MPDRQTRSVVPKEASKPRLLVLTSTFPRWRNDPEPPFVHELSRRLVEPFEITILAPRAPGSLERETMDGLRVVRFPYFIRRWENLATHGGGILNRLRKNRWNYLLVPLFLLGQSWALIRLLRRERFDVIHAHWLIPQGLVAVVARWLSRRPIPLVCTSHGGDLFGLRGGLMRALKRRVMNASARVTVVSAAMRDEVLSMGIAPEQVEIIPMGVDLRHRFTPDPRIKRGEYALLFVGRLVEKKGLHLLLQALPRVLANYPGTRLTIAGDGPLEPELRRLIDTLDIREQVDFLGMVSQSELPDLYRRATLFVAPFVVAENGDQEGLGLVLVEAAGCGCPLICGGVAAVKDVIEDGETGVLVKPGDGTALSEAIIDLLADPDRQRQLVATNARQHCLRAFDWTSIAERYATMLSEVAAHRAPL
ncbi:MAG: glycosyltransferase [Chromatiaceae bacterium]|nr:glycosyltransferase [Chromatiaceae bacterium]MCF8003390.1 glycosyltransferase [Chromatiaceae bacterium]